MKKLEITFGIIIILLVIVFSVGVMAVGFSPSSLIYNLEVGEEDCQIITVSSDSETILVSDKWAENKDIEWKVSLFEKDAGFHGININYDNELGINKRQVNVCLSGGKAGEYHGVMLLREEQQGNSIIQMGVWLKAIISEKPQTPSAESSSGGSSGGGGDADAGGGGGGSPVNNQNNQNTGEEANDMGNSGSELTGEVIEQNIEESISSPAEKIIGLAFVLAGVIGLFLNHRYKRIRNEDKLMQ